MGHENCHFSSVVFQSSRDLGSGEIKSAWRVKYKIDGRLGVCQMNAAHDFFEIIHVQEFDDRDSEEIDRLLTVDQ